MSLYKINRRTIYLINFLIFLLLIFYHENKFHIESRENLKHHGEVLAESLWKINDEIPFHYLNLTTRTEGYEKIDVYLYPLDKPFLSIRNSIDKRYFRLLTGMRLIRRDRLEEPVYYDGEEIGKIVVTVLNRNIYIYLYEIVILFLFGAAINGLLGAVKRNRELEKTVEIRTREYRDSELRLRTLVDNIPGVSYRCYPDKDWRITYVSDEIFRLTGYNSIDFMVENKQSLQTILETDERETVLLQIRKALDNDTSFGLEHVIKGKSGERCWVYNKGRGLRRDGGDIYIDGVMIDTSERWIVEKEKENLKKQIENKNRLESIGRLAGGIAHDFNNLLTPILGYAEFLEEEVRGSELFQSYVKQIIEASMKSKQLIHQLLSYSKSRELNVQLLDLNQLLFSFKSLLEGTLSVDIDLELEIDPDLPNIYADKGQFEQIIMNLAVNARDAMPDGGVLGLRTTSVVPDFIVSKTNHDLSETGVVFLIVSDTGVGLAEHTREHLFEPFFSTKGDLGTGLGLSTVYGIVKQHQGEIWVDSSRGGGTRFILMFPVTLSENQ